MCLMLTGPLVGNGEVSKKESKFMKQDDKRRNKQSEREPDRNPDPITGAPGAHPVGTGVVAVAGGAAGAAALPQLARRLERSRVP
jgi:hypothetical protein